MDFDSSVSVLFKDVITKIDSRLQVCRNAGNSFQDLRQHLFHTIDKMGEASARAQGLAGAITTGKRLEISEHHLYIMKDSEVNYRVIGFLKVGRKRLFVYDRHGQQWEMNPLCVLDFYVHESRQRMGCGRRLFDFMLKNENQSPQHLAVDRPSHKFSSFLAKHYGLKAEIPQVNNFVIFEGFFSNRPGDGDFIHNRRSGFSRPADYPGTDGCESLRVNQNNSYNKQHHAHMGMPATNSRPPSGYHASHAALLPSSHHSPQNLQQDDGVLRELSLNPRSAHILNTAHKTLMGRNSPKVGHSDSDLRSLSAGSNTERGMGLQHNMYSRHQVVQGKEPCPPSPTHALMSRPPSGSRNRTEKAKKSPPLLQHDGPPRDYLSSFNMHQEYQGRGGHLKVPPDPRVGLPQPSSNTANISTTTVIGLPAIGERNKQPGPPDSTRSAYSYGGYYTRPIFLTNGDTSWTVTGVLRNQNQLSARHHGHSRLW